MNAKKHIFRWISVILSLILLVQTGAVGLAANAPETKPEVTERKIKTFYDGESLISEEITGLREESVKHFRLENGQNIAVMYSAPVNYLDSDGEWKEIDNSLVLNDENSDNPFYTLKASDVDLRLPESIGKNEKIYIAQNDIPFEMGPISEGNNKSEKAIISNDFEAKISYDENASAIEKSNSAIIQSVETASKVEYKAAFDGADLEYTISSSGIKEDVVINEARDNYTYCFELNYGSLVPAEMEDGSIGFFVSADDEEAVYTLSAPYMYDAEGEYSDEVSMSLENNILTVTADEKWINDKDRAFPVTVDPSVSVYSSSFQDSHVRKIQNGDNYGSSSSLFSGKSLGTLRRTYIKFSLPALPDNAMIMNADLCITQDSTPDNFDSDCKNLYLFDLTGYSSWTESGIKWNNQPLSQSVNGPQTDGTPVAYVIAGDNSSNHIYKFNVTEVLKGWYKNNNNNGFMLSTENENNYAQSKLYSSDASSNRPYTVITYTENIGVREYWPYQSVDMGEAGKAYVNSQNGSLYYTHSDASTYGLVLPVGVSHFYAGPQDFLSGNVLNMKFGKGFTLNIIERLDDNNNAYIDSYGNSHNLIYYTGNKFYVEDDPSTIEHYDSGYHIMEYLNGTVKTFNSAGYLISVTDNNSNQIQITYSGGRITQVKSGANQTITFSYNSSNYLTSITDYAGRVTQYAYNADGYLTGITYPDLTTTTLSYSSGLLYEVKNAVNAKWRFTGETVYYASNFFRRIASVTAYGENNSSSYSDKVDLTYNGFSTTVENNHNDSVEIEFDVCGRAVSHTAKGNTSKVMYNTGGVLSNTVSSRSNSFSLKPNLIKKENQRVSTWYENGTGVTRTISSDRTDHYSTSLKVVGSNADAEYNMSGMYNKVRVTPGKTYTATVGINIDGIASAGSIYLRLDCGNETVQSVPINTTGDAWMPVSATITAPSGSILLDVRIVFDGFTGTAYSDIAQVTEGGTANLYNMVPDSDFTSQLRYSSDEWTVSGYIESANKTIRVYGKIASNSCAQQTFPLKGGAGETFVFGFSGKSVPIPFDREYCFGAKVIFLSGNTEVDIVSFPLSISNSEWQHVLTAVSSSSDFDNVRIELRNDKMIKDAFFKDLFLYKGTGLGYNYSYNNNKYVTGIMDGAGNSRQMSYSGADIIRVTQNSGLDVASDTEYVYDSNHNLLSATDMLGITAEYTYPSSGNKGLPLSVTISDENNTSSATTTFAYTSDYNYLTSVTDPSGAVTSYEYNASKGLTTKVTDPNGNETNYTYNSKDLISSIYADVGNDVAQVEYHYDSLGRITDISNDDIDYSFTYDIFGRSDTVNNSPYNTLYDYTYNSDSTVARVDYAAGNYAEFTYDDRDRVETASYNGDLAYEYCYDDDNHLTKVYDTDNNISVNYTYDPLGRPTAQTRSDGKSAVFTYNSRSQPDKTVITESEGLSNSVLSEQSYTYDTYGRVTGTQFGSITGSPSVSYSYDSLSRVSSVSNSVSSSKSVISNYTYKTVGTNQTGYIGSISYTQTTGSNNYTGIYPTMSYNYDANGNVTEVYKGNTMINRYHYDSLNRLVRDDNAESGHTEVYTYDVCGDILSVKEYSYTTADNPQGYYHEYPYRYYDSTWPNAQSSYDHVPSYYDEEGMACDYFGNSVTWNSQKKLESLNDVIFFTYDENGMLKERTAYGITTEYYYVGTTLVSLEFDNVKMVFYYGADGRPCGFTYNGTPYYYITDLFGNIAAIYNASGTIVTEYTYDAWGYPLDTTGSLSGTVGYDNPFRYRGYFFDEETLFYFLQTRFYDPFTRRFVSADAYLVAGDHINSTNMFAYCLNNPVMYVDPSGHEYRSSITNDSVSILFEIMGDILLAASFVSPASMQKLSDNVFDKGDYFYIAGIIFFSKYYQILKLENNKKNGVYVNKDDEEKDALHFEVCRSFLNKDVCLIVASYIPSKFGATPQEIYAHAFAYYATDNYRNIDYSEYDGFEGFSEYGTRFFNERADYIDVGHDSKFAVWVYNFIWRTV